MATTTLNAANCTGAPECIAINRQDCGTYSSREGHTCGECLPGTIGTLGAANSKCVDLKAIDDTCSNGLQVKYLTLPRIPDGSPDALRDRHPNPNPKLDHLPFHECLKHLAFYNMADVKNPFALIHGPSRMATKRTWIVEDLPVFDVRPDLRAS